MSVHSTAQPPCQRLLDEFDQRHPLGSLPYDKPEDTRLYKETTTEARANISTFDLQHGFWQAALDPKTAHRTAFTCEYGTFQYKVVPMGLLSSAQFFQSFVETKLDRHGILYRKVHERSDATNTYIDEDGARSSFPCPLCALIGRPTVVHPGPSDLIISRRYAAKQRRRRDIARCTAGVSDAARHT